MGFGVGAVKCYFELDAKFIVDAFHFPHPDDSKVGSILEDCHLYLNREHISLFILLVDKLIGLFILQLGSCFLSFVCPYVSFTPQIM